MWTLLGAIGSLLVALSLSFLAVLLIAVVVLIALALISMTAKSSAGSS